VPDHRYDPRSIHYDPWLVHLRDCEREEAKLLAQTREYNRLVMALIMPTPGRLLDAMGEETER
jgi:hypothetical protein